MPIYLHPAAPDATVVERYYKEYVKSFPAILNAGWGFTVETATQSVRMVLSGVFEAYPRLKIIVGHLGEGIPFLLWRIDQALSRPGNAEHARSASCSAGTSGSPPAATSPTRRCCARCRSSGVDRILFAVDWPYRREQAGGRLGDAHPAVRGGPREDSGRQRQAAVEDVAASTATARISRCARSPRKRKANGS